ncbi:DotI/IcmL family type IV secretion protein [Aeromonas veronii]|uniref:DotI/IcmL family type IV secretion protein n=1 Tax=Aeromonas TaxID=642 RepID=UPI0031585859
MSQEQTEEVSRPNQADEQQADLIAQAVATALQLANKQELNFLRRLSRTLAGGLIGAVGLAALLGTGIFVLKTHQVDREYFAYDSKTGVMVPLKPLDRPNMTPTGLLGWTMDCVERSHSFDVVNYRKQLTSVMGCFTTPGWNGFYSALERSGNLTEVIDKKMIATATRAGPAVIQKQGINPQSGVYTYIVRFPMNVVYQGEGRMPSQKLMMTALVERVDTSESPDGVGISQIIGEPQ